MKVGRNDPCPCGSGKKYKHCCYAKDSVKRAATEIEESESDDTVENDASAEDETISEQTKEQRSSFQRNKGKTKFHSDGRCRGSSSQTRAQRGSQRGT